MDMGAYVVIVNAEKVVVTGNKFTQKVYTRHTGRPGSRKEETFQKLQAVRRPCCLFIAGSRFRVFHLSSLGRPGSRKKEMFQKLQVARRPCCLLMHG